MELKNACLHHIDRFFATLTADKQELDQNVEIFVRRVMQLRRTICKQVGMATRYKELLRKYAEECKTRWKMAELVL